MDLVSPVLAPDAAPSEFGSLPLDPIYAWSMRLEPVETLIGRTQQFIHQLALETLATGRDYSEDELEARFLAFFDGLVAAGVLIRLPDVDPAMGARILGPRRWLRAQRVRIHRLAARYREHGSADPQAELER
jgi:hypothetical protein